MAARVSQYSARRKPKTCSPSQPLSLRRVGSTKRHGLSSRASAGLGGARDSQVAPCGVFGGARCFCLPFGGVLCVCFLCLCRCLRWLPCLPVVLLLFGLAVAGCPCASSWGVAFCPLVGRGGLAGFCVFVSSRWVGSAFSAVLCFAVAFRVACWLCRGCFAFACRAFSVVVAVGCLAVGCFSPVVVAVAGVAFSAVSLLLLLCPSAVVGGLFFCAKQSKPKNEIKSQRDF